MVSLRAPSSNPTGELTNVGDKALHVHLLDILKRRDVNPELLRACVMRRVVERQFGVPCQKREAAHSPGTGTL